MRTRETPPCSAGEKLGRRRTWHQVLACLLCSTALTTLHAAEPVFPDVDRDERLVFPRDHGAHPTYRTEWWYVTGWLRTTGGEELGFQVTFFRSRLPLVDGNPSRFAPRQLLFAHAALADAKLGRLMHDQRIAREGFDIAAASSNDADVTLDGWRFVRVASKTDTPNEGPGADTLHFKTRVTSARFALDLDLRATGPLLAQGADARWPGYSQKGPQPGDASRYYSVPQLAVTGAIVRNRGSKKERVEVAGTAWLDREWSSAYLDPQAVGWDWVGLNFDDGGALMAFQMRDRSGDKLWAGGSRRFADGRVERYAPDDVRFAPLRSWTSPTSGTTWPVAQRVTITSTPTGVRRHPVSPLVLRIEPLMDNQELDSRASTGTIYWEGAVRVFNEESTRDSPRGSVGRGYLELTGYWHPIRFGFQ